jgi:hypothetical protein
MFHLKRWLARLSFSMLILSGLCGWTVYKAVETAGWTPTALLWFAAAIAAGIVGMIGVRLRHAPELSDEEKR